MSFVFAPKNVRESCQELGQNLAFQLWWRVSHLTASDSKMGEKGVYPKNGGFPANFTLSVALTVAAIFHGDFIILPNH